MNDPGKVSDYYPAPDELRDAYINDSDSANNSDEDNFPVPVLAEPRKTGGILPGGEARESNLDNPAMSVATEQDSRGGELDSLPKPPDPLPFWIWSEQKQSTDRSPFE